MNLDIEIKKLCQELIGEYYKKNSLFDYTLLDPIQNREYAYFDLENNCHRGLVFMSRKEIEIFLKNPGLVSFHSGVHLTNNPWSTKKELKQVFEFCLVLDFDVTRNLKDFSFTKQIVLLEKVQELIKIILIDEFKIPSNCIFLFFSGSKGFHLYIKNSYLNSLINSNEAIHNFLSLLKKKELTDEQIIENPYTLSWRSKGVIDDLHLDSIVSTDTNKLIKSTFSLNKSSFLMK